MLVTQPPKVWSSLHWYDLIAVAQHRLAQAGVASPRRDAEELAAFVLGIPWSKLALHYRELASPEQSCLFDELVVRRIRRIPLQLITGTTGFRKIEVEVCEGVFIPRPETECLVEVVLQHLKKLRSSELPSRQRVLEIGTGSGAIALSLATEDSFCRIVATDVSRRALECARKNAYRLGVANRVSFVACDSLSVLSEKAEGYFDIVVTNPPYIPSSDIDDLEVEVKEHDPRCALDGGPDGLSFIRVLATHAPRFVGPSGMIAFEVGDGQADTVLRDPAITEAIERYSMTVAGPFQDLAGHPRVIGLLRHTDQDKKRGRGDDQ